MAEEEDCSSCGNVEEELWDCGSCGNMTCEGCAESCTACGTTLCGNCGQEADDTCGACEA